MTVGTTDQAWEGFEAVFPARRTKLAVEITSTSILLAIHNSLLPKPSHKSNLTLAHQPLPTRPRHATWLALKQDKLVHVLAPSRDFLALPLALAEVDAGEVGGCLGRLAVRGDFDVLRGQGMLARDRFQT